MSVTSIGHLTMSNSIWHRITKYIYEVIVDKDPLLAQTLRQLIQSRWSMRIVGAQSPPQFVPRMLNGGQIRWSCWPRQGGDPGISDYWSYRGRAMRCGVIILEDQLILLNGWDDDRKHDVVFVSLCVERTADCHCSSSSAVPNASPHHHASTSETVMLKNAARGEPFTRHSMDPHSAIVEV